VSSPKGGHARRQRTAPFLISHTRSCGTDPRISVATQTSTTADALPPPNPTPQTNGANYARPVNSPHSI
jgi:hypothetical protein